MASGVRVRMKWYGTKVKKEVRREVGTKLAIIGEMVRAEVVRNISASTLEHGPSLPGEFPHAETGKLRQSYFSEVDRGNLVVIVGSPLEYALYLELGTENMAARPHLRRSLLEMRGKAERILARSTADTTGRFEIEGG